MPQPPARTGRATLGIQAVGGPAAPCDDNPCDPTCQRFADEPDAAIGSPMVDAGPAIYGGGLLSESNVPQGFQNKGSDPDGVCTPGCATAGCAAACQFDQRCSSTESGKCTAFAPGEDGTCQGVDLTVGVGCHTPDGQQRVILVCNRGTVAAPAGVSCWTFPGNSQQMPSSPPDTSSGTRIATTTQSLDPGGCESLYVANSSFSSSGVQELICNVPGSETVTVATSAAYPTTATAVSGELSWLDVDGAFAVGSSEATAPLVGLPGGETRGVAYSGFGFSIPSAATITRVRSEVAWRLSTNAYATTLGLEATNAGAALGTEVTNTTRPTSLVSAVQTLSGNGLGGLTPADLNGSGFAVHVRATR